MFGIKGVFKTLIGTVLGICVISLFIEYINITSSTTFMNGIMARSVEKSADYFAQETYKSTGGGSEDADNGSGNLKTLYGLRPDGTEAEAATGTFYVYGREETFNILYGNNSPFEAWYINNGTALRGTWKNLDSFASAMGINTGSLTTSDKDMGKSYVENMMTPLNLGIPYLDEETVTKIAKWNLTYLLSEGKKSNIHIDNTESYESSRGRVGETLGKYIMYHGFRVYPDSLQVNTSKFEVLDLRTAAGRNRFEEITAMDANNLYSAGEDRENGVNSLAGLDERACIGITTIEYSVDMDYVGVTPMRHLLNYLANRTKVAGWGNQSYDTSERMYNADGVGQYGTYRSGGRTENGSTDNVQQIAVRNQMYYYIVR